MGAAGLCQAGMPVPTQVAAALGRGPPAPPFRTQPGWHQLAPLFLAATEQPSRSELLVCDRGWVPTALLTAASTPEPPGWEWNANRRPELEESSQG